MVEKLQEKLRGDDYSYSYSINNNNVLIINFHKPVGIGSRYRLERVGYLEIQKTGINFSLERLVFVGSHATSLHKQSRFKNKDINLNKEGKVRELTKYALKFKEIFNSSERMQSILIGYFKDLMKFMQ